MFIIDNTGYSLSQAALLELPTIDRLMLVFSGIELEDAEAVLDRLKAPSEVHRLSRKMKLVLDFVEQKNSSPEGMLDLFNKIDDALFHRAWAGHLVNPQGLSMGRCAGEYSGTEC